MPPIDRKILIVLGLIRDVVIWLLVVAWLTFTIVLALGGIAEASPHAVVRLPSHGVSGTVIATQQGSSLILTCAHGFPGNSASKPITVDAPWPATTAGTQKVGVQLLRVDARADLALVRLNYGPTPWVAAVAPEGFQPGRCLSVGYDEMKTPPQCRPADILRVSGGWTHTAQKPWHGRSGGGLLDEKTGQLVGVVSGYVGPQVRTEIMPGTYGIYAGHASILAFLRPVGATPTPRPSGPRLTEERSYTPPQWLLAPCPGGT